VLRSDAGEAAMDAAAHGHHRANVTHHQGRHVVAFGETHCRCETGARIRGHFSARGRVP
jgi:hypothetical protein